MTFLVKFMVKGILVVALEAGETISEIATHIVTPAKVGYWMAPHIDLSDSKDNDATNTKTEHLIRSRYVDHASVSKI